MSHWDFRPPPADDDAPPLPRRNRDERRTSPASDDDVGWPGTRDGAAGIPVRAGNQGTARSGGRAGDPRGSRTRARFGPEPDGQRDESWDTGDQDTALYPLTYERDPFVQAAPGPPPPTRQPWLPAARPDGLVAPGLPFLTGAGSAAGAAPPGAEYPAEEWAGSPDELGWEDEQGLDGGQRWEGGREQGPPRWLLPAGIAVAGVAVGASAVLLFGGHAASPAASTGSTGTGASAPAAAPGATAASTPAAAAAAAGPLTMAQAQGVLAAYSSANNSANARFDAALLGTVETGSSAAIDAGLYQSQLASKASAYPPFSAVQATYYLPGDEAATGPRWFVVQVANAFNSSPGKVTDTEYLLFTQASPGGAWQDAIEPYILAAGTVPQVAAGSDGLAAAVSPDAATAAVAPGQLPAVTAASLDAAPGHATVADPGNLTDVTDAKSWRANLKGGAVTDVHAAAGGQEFALRTADGGALVFYTAAATVTVTPPAGSGLRLNVPGFLSSSQTLSRAVLDYQEQFAAYDPPAGQGAPRVVADYSGITGKG